MTDYMPHWMCLLGQPLLIGIHVAADAAIFVAYSVIAWMLVRARKHPRIFALLDSDAGDWIFASFAIFIGACGVTHLMEIVVLWWPAYWLQAFVKVVTACASATTAIVLVRLVAVLRAQRNGA